MAARKLAQEVDKCFKKVTEGVSEFEAIYEKIEQSNNPAQKEKLEDNLKREIKKLQRLRDQIKTWAASNDIKDKGPLLENRRLIETQMEKFKAVEKAMKTKAYSKEGLSAAAKLDPKEQAKVEAGEFLSSMVDELEQQIEALEAEGETLQATMKKGKGHNAKAERIAEIERIIERHKWHQGKLELIRRSLENGGVDTDQVTDLEESIRYYVSDGMNDDFMEDEGMYDDLSLRDEEDAYGMTGENDKLSSQDTQSIQDDVPDVGPSIPVSKSRPAAAEASGPSGGRRPSTQMKSPLPTLATMHNPLSALNNGGTGALAMKPASLPTRPAGEGLKYASAAAAAAERNSLGIAPLPPPPGSAPTPGFAASPALAAAQLKANTAASSPSTTSIQMATQGGVSLHADKSSTPAPVAASTSASSNTAQAQHGHVGKPETAKAGSSRGKAPAQAATSEAASASKSTSQPNGVTNGVKAPAATTGEAKEEESIYHLPSSLRDLVDSFEATKRRPVAVNSAATLRMQAASQASAPDAADSEPPRVHLPDVRFQSASQFPQEPLAIFDDPRLYSRIDPDTLFYVFYYKQGTYQQYLAAKALKDQSWRFHKQYQTWFQRHEEPKSITEEFEQGTYRFFDYESTWMNRRKADFKFAYKFLEDDI